MKSKPVRFGRAIVLSIFFFVTVFSLFGSHDGSNSGWTNVHIWAGSLPDTPLSLCSPYW